MSEHLCLHVCMHNRGQQQVSPHPLPRQLLRRLEVGTTKRVCVLKHVCKQVCVRARVEMGQGGNDDRRECHPPSYH